MNTFPRETVEFLPLNVLDGDDPVTDFEVALVSHAERPEDWEANTELDGEHGVMVDGPTLGRGLFGVWARVTANPETPVLFLGFIYIS